MINIRKRNPGFRISFFLPPLVWIRHSLPPSPPYPTSSCWRSQTKDHTWISSTGGVFTVTSFTHLLDSPPPRPKHIYLCPCSARLQQNGGTVDNPKSIRASAAASGGGRNYEFSSGDQPLNFLWPDGQRTIGGLMKTRWSRLISDVKFWAFCCWKSV